MKIVGGGEIQKENNLNFAQIISQQEETKNHHDEEDEEEIDSDIEELFLDAIGEIQEASVKLNQSMRSQSLFNRVRGTTTANEFQSFTSASPLDISDASSEDNEPQERDQLPWFKDPNVKVSIWAILKDSIGKDISKISVPVYFNDPTSLL